MNLKRFLIILLSNLTVLAVCLVICEIALRIWAPDWLEQKMDFLSSEQLVDDYGSDRSWKYRSKDGRFVAFDPFSGLNMHHAEFRTVAHMNDLGLRRNKIPAKETTCRLPVFGDSFVFGVGVKDEETFISLVQEKHPSCDIMNFGVPGSSLHDQRFILSQRFDELEGFRKVIFAYYLGNDFEEIHRNATEAQPGHSPDTLKSRPDRGILWDMNAFIRNSHVLSRLYILQLVKGAFLKIRNKSGRNKILLGGIRPMLRSESQFMKEWRLTVKRELSDLKQMQDSLGFKSYFIIIPQKFNINRELRDAKLKYYGLDVKEADPIAPAEAIISVLEEAGFPYLDTSPCLQEFAKEEDLYFVHDDHFNALGNKRTAHCIDGFLNSIINEEQH